MAPTAYDSSRGWGERGRRRARVVGVGSGTPGPGPCADAQCCNVNSTISEWIANVIRTGVSTNPSCCYQKLRPTVLVVQAAEDGH